MVAGTQAEVWSGEGKGGGSPARAGRCALRCARAVRWKEGAVAAVRARAPRFLGRCYGDAPRHPALLGVADGGRRRG